MGMLTEVGTFTIPSTVSSKTITLVNVNLKGQIVILFSTTPGSVDTLENDAIACMGWGDSSSSQDTDQFAVSNYSENAVTIMNTHRGISDDDIYYEVDGGGTEINVGSLTSMTDGNGTTAGTFVVNWAVVDGNEATVAYMVIGGDQTSSDITNIKIGNLLAATSSGNQATTGVGFKPTCVLLLTSANDNNALSGGGPNAVVEASFAFGVLTNALGGGAVAMVSEDASADSDTSNQRTGAGAGSPSSAYLSHAVKSGSPGITTLAQFVSMDSDGFTLNYSDEAAAAHYIGYLAIRGGIWEVVASALKTSTGAQSITNTKNFTPKGCIVFGNWGQSGIAIANVCWGAVGGAKIEKSMMWYDDDGRTTSITTRYFSTDSTFIAQDAVGNPKGEFDITSFDSNGVTWNYSAAGVAGGGYFCLMIGAGSAQESAPRRTHVAMF